MPLHNLPLFKQPREKLQTHGSDALRDEELLAILLRTGNHHQTALELARHLLKNRSLSQVLNQPLTTLRSIPGLGPAKITALKATLALAERISPHDSHPAVENARDVALLVQHLSTYQQEHLVALYLNARNRVIHQQTISIGTINSSLIHAREVFAPAFKHLAVSIILAHNHPSGDLQPSVEDITTTEKLVNVGELMDIQIVDHVIIGKQGWFSFREHQLV